MRKEMLLNNGLHKLNYVMINQKAGDIIRYAFPGSICS